MRVREFTQEQQVRDDRRFVVEQGIKMQPVMAMKEKTKEGTNG